jgi:hypothetical protein
MAVNGDLGDTMRDPMGGSSDFAHLVGKAAFDPVFARRLRENPSEALRGVGIEPTDEVLAALGDVDLDSIEALAGALGDERGIV